MPIPKTREIKWLLKTVPRLELKDGTYIPLAEWIRAEIRKWDEEVSRHASRQKRRNIRLRGIGTQKNTPRQKPEGADLTI